MGSTGSAAKWPWKVLARALEGTRAWVGVPGAVWARVWGVEGTVTDGGAEVSSFPWLSLLAQCPPEPRGPGELQEAVVCAERGRGVSDKDLFPGKVEAQGCARRGRGRRALLSPAGIVPAGEPRDRVRHEVHPAHVPERRQE